MPELEILRLDYNQLTGDVPSTLGDASALVALYLSENVLSGSVPPELGQLEKLRFLVLVRGLAAACALSHAQLAQHRWCTSFVSNQQVPARATAR